MVKGQRFGRHLTATIVTDTGGDAVFPPLTATQLASFFPLTAHLLFRYLDKEFQNTALRLDPALQRLLQQHKAHLASRLTIIPAIGEEQLPMAAGAFGHHADLAGGKTGSLQLQQATLL